MEPVDDGALVPPHGDRDPAVDLFVSEPSRDRRDEAPGLQALVRLDREGFGERAFRGVVSGRGRRRDARGCNRDAREATPAMAQHC